MEIEERRILKSKRKQLTNNLDTLLDMRLNNSITQEQYNKKYSDIIKLIETTDRKLTRYNEITKQGELLYHVSNLGRVKRLETNITIFNKKTQYNKKVNGKILKNTKDKKGYLYVTLCKNRKR